MSAGQTQTGQRFQFSWRRSIYGWGSLTLATLSVACLIYWAVSLRPRKADFETVYFGGLYLSADHGVLRLRADQWISVKNTLEHFRQAEKEKQFKQSLPRMQKLYPDLKYHFSSDYEFDLPGLNYRRIEYNPSGSGSPIWMLSLSPLVPFAVMALLAVLCLYRYVAACRRPNSQPSAIPESPRLA